MRADTEGSCPAVIGPDREEPSAAEGGRHEEPVVVGVVQTGHEREQAQSLDEPPISFIVFPLSIRGRCRRGIRPSWR